MPEKQRNEVSIADKEMAWLELARQSGNATRASRELKRRGVEVSASTLSKWKREDPPHWEEVRNSVLRQIRGRMADEMEQLFHEEVAVERKVLKALEGKIGDLSGHELSTALRNTGVTKALNIEKSAPARGEAPAPAEHYTLPEIMEGLKAIGVKIRVEQALDVKPIEGTATEIETGTKD